MNPRDELKTYDQEKKIIKEPYKPYIIQEPLESHYFPRWVLGFTRLNNRFVIRPGLYGKEITHVKIHEKVHNEEKTGNEYVVETETRHRLRTRCYD